MVHPLPDDLESLLAQALAQSTNAVIVTDEEARITYVNQQFTELTGWTREELEGLNPRVLKSGETAPETYAAMWSALRTGGAWRGILHNLKKGGETYWAQVTVSAVRDRAGATTHFLAVQEDISRRVHAELSLDTLRKELESRVAERTEEIEALVYSMVHDIRGALRSIISFEDLALADLEAGDLVIARESMDRVAAIADRTNCLLEDLMRFARLGRVPLEWVDVDLSVLAEDIVAELRGGSPGRRSVIEIESGLRTCGTPGLLRATLWNLLSNAWKFTGRREVTRITVRAVSTEPLVICVSDNGAGFDRSRADRLFQAFARYHNRAEFEGTGVGMAIVRRAVERHGGDVWAESAPDKGTEVFLRLPGQMTGLAAIRSAQ